MFEKLAIEYINIMNNIRDRLEIEEANIFSFGERGVLLLLVSQDNLLSPLELSEKLKVVPSRITAILKSLEKKEFIIRLKDPSDGRKSLIKISDKGNQLFREKYSSLRKTIEDNFIRIGEEDAKEFVRIMKKFIK